jgi:hypothetical protein
MEWRAEYLSSNPGDWQQVEAAHAWWRVTGADLVERALPDSGDIREAELPWPREQAQHMAAPPPVDNDGDTPAGLFVISDERAAISVWEVRGGSAES